MGPTQLLVDADAWLCLRALGWHERLLAHPELHVMMAERTFKVELNGLRCDLDLAQGSGALEVVGVLKGTPAQKKFKEWTRQNADVVYDKGEAEAIAWASCRPPEVKAALLLVFATNDQGAQKLARSQNVVAWAVFDLLVEGVIRGWWAENEAKAAIQRWEDNPHDRFGRPKDFTTLESTWARAMVRRQGQV